MSLNHHKLYMDDVFRLAKTIAIKSEYSASRMNTYLALVYGPQIVDHDRPETWKYYLNLCGIPHSTDEVMHVISLDTLETIEFTKASLEIHTATAAGYQYGSRYYKELLVRFPAQEALIKGILYPAVMAKLLAAPNHSIVAYDATMVESNEEYLISQIDDYCQSYFRRWWVSGFNVNHPLYAASFFGTFYQSLAPKIIELRERACNTPQAHSFHVRMHLASNHDLDEFLPYLTQKQALWLYRNIEYIQRHAGSQSTFDWLTKNILTDRGLPLVGYDLVHDAAGFLQGDILPKASFTATSLNGVRSVAPEFIEESTIKNKISGVAEGNAAFDLRNPGAISDLAASKENSYTTKILESAFVDVSENSAVSSIEVALGLWVYAAATDRFNVYTRINHPVTGAELAMSALDAYYLFMQAYASAHSSGMPNIPKLYAAAAPVWPRPSLAALWNLCIQSDTPYNRIEQMRLIMPGTRQFLNLDQFKLAVEDLEDAANKLSFIVASGDTFEKSTSYKAVYKALWQDQEFTKPETGTETIEYLVGKGLDMGELDAQQWQEVYTSLFTSVTGLDMQTTAAQSQMQKAMISIMRRLSSYSMLFVDPLTGTSIRSLGWSNLLIQETASSAKSYYEIRIVDHDTQLVTSNGKVSYEVPIGESSIGFWFTSSEPTNVMDNTSDIVFLNEDSDNNIDVIINSLGVTPVNDDDEPDDSFIPGLADTLADMTSFLAAPNQYNSDCIPRLIIPTTANLDDWVTQDRPLMIRPPDITPNLLGDFRVLNIPQRLRYFSLDSNVYILDGIASNYGNVDTGVFEGFMGQHVIDSFKYMPFFEYEVDAWQGAIGHTLVEPMDPSTGSIDITEVPGLTRAIHQINMPLRATAFIGSVDFTLTAPVTAKFTLVPGSDKATFSFKANAKELLLSPWVPTIAQTSWSLRYQTPVIDAGSFTFNGRPIEGPAFTNHTRAVHLLSLVSRTWQFSMPGLHHYGDTQLSGFIDFGLTHLRTEDPSLTFVSSVRQVLVSSTGQVTTTSFNFTSLTTPAVNPDPAVLQTVQIGDLFITNNAQQTEIADFETDYYLL